MTDHDDAMLRAALQAEAEGVEASPRMLERIRSAGGQPSSTIRRSRWLLAVAVVALAAGTVAVVISTDEPHRVDVSDDRNVPPPTSPPDDRDAVPGSGDLGAWCAIAPADLALFMDPGASDTRVAAVREELASSKRVASVRYVDAAESASLLAQTFADQPALVASLNEDDVPTAFLVDLVDRKDSDFMADELRTRAGVYQAMQQACPEAPTQSGPPAQAVAVTERGHIVVIDTASGEVVRDLGGFDDPTDQATQARPGGAFVITGVALHPNGRDVYFETCCEPAPGAIYRIPIDGSVSIAVPELQPVFYGDGSDISADGRRMAFVTGPVVSVVDLESGEVVHKAESADGTHEWIQAALNHDGTVLAIERLLERGPSGEVLRSDARTTSLLDGKYEEHPTSSGRFVPLWIDGGTTLANASAPGAFPRDDNVDASGTWILEVTAEGRLVGRSDQTLAIADGPFSAADW